MVSFIFLKGYLIFIVPSFFKFKFAFAFSGLIQIIAGIITIVYMKTMPLPLREYMADNLRSNYTGGYGMGYLERQFDRYVDWTQINVGLKE
jgi:hypothetical protein